MSKAKVENTDLSYQLTQPELDILNTKLDAAIKVKVEAGELAFSSNPLEPKPTTVDLSMFGLHNPDDIKIFLLSPAGETVRHEIYSELILEEAIKEEKILLIQQQFSMLERLRGLLFLGLLKEEEHAKKIQNELLELQQEKLLHEPINTPKQVTSVYQKQINDLTQYQKELQKQITQLEHEHGLIHEKYDTYEAGLKEFDELSDHYEERSEEELEMEIARFKQEAQAIEEDISEKSDKKGIHKLENKLNTVNLKIASLEQILAKQKGEKVFADEEGNTEGVKCKHAAFVHHKHQRIVKDKDGKHCLLERGQKWEHMSDDEKNHAKHHFERSRHHVRAVKHLVQDLKKQELELNTSRTATLKAEHIMVGKQLNLLQRLARENAPKAQHNDPHMPLHPPLSTRTPEHIKGIVPPRPSPKTPLETFAAFTKTLHKEQAQRMTWGNLFSFVKTIPSPQFQKDADKFLTDEMQKNLPQNRRDKLDLSNPQTLKERIKEMLKMTPVPETTMQVFLQQMSKFEESYKPNVTAEKSPLQLQEEQSKAPTPFDTKPRMH